MIFIDDLVNIFRLSRPVRGPARVTKSRREREYTLGRSRPSIWSTRQETVYNLGSTMGIESTEQEEGRT